MVTFAQKKDKLKKNSYSLSKLSKIKKLKKFGFFDNRSLGEEHRKRSDFRSSPGFHFSSEFLSNRSNGLIQPKHTKNQAKQFTQSPTLRGLFSSKTSGDRHSILHKIKSDQIKVSQPGDRYEREADRISDKVILMPNQQAEAQRKSIQDNESNQHNAQSFPRLLPSCGEPLPKTIREFFEPRFGQDFSTVRVHTENKATQISEELGAQAFTYGRNIYFGSGKYDFQSNKGRQLLAHELTHVLQQNPMPPPSTGRPFGSQSVSTTPPFIQRREFGESVRFDSLPGLPPRATVLGPYRDSAIAEELYGDPTIPITFLSDSTIAIDYDQLLTLWRSYFDEQVTEEIAAGNSWPFAGFSADDVRQYIDEKTAAVAVNLVSGRVFLTVEGSDQRVEAPLSWFTSDNLDVVPIVPPRNSREEAVAEQPQYEFFREQRGLTPVLFYRDSNGLIWPTIVNPQTAPRIMSVYPRAFEAARRDVEATRDAFIDLAWWYVGARFVPRVRTSPGTQTGRLIISRGATLSPQEMAMAQRLVNEGRTVRVLAESTRQGVRTADFVVDGIRTELKTISNLTSQDISGALGRRILEGAGQAPHIIADVRGQAGMTRELAQRAIRRAFGADTLQRIQQIRIIGRGFDIIVPRLP